MGDDDASDHPAIYRGHTRTPLFQAYRPLARHGGMLETPRGSMEVARDIYEIGEVAAVIPYDPQRDLLVLQRQFRLASHTLGENAIMVELAAGLVELGEDPALAAIRETEEELGQTPSDLIYCTTFMPSTGWLGERAFLYAARVDATRLPDHAGEAGEAEFTVPFAVSPDVALKAVDEGRIRNGFTVLGLLWFARHKQELCSRWALSVAR